MPACSTDGAQAESSLRKDNIHKESYTNKDKIGRNKINETYVVQMKTGETKTSYHEDLFACLFDDAISK